MKRTENSLRDLWDNIKCTNIQIIWVSRRRQWQPTPVFLPGESQGRGNLVGCHLWSRTELDMTEATQQLSSSSSSRVLLILVIVLFVSVCLFFNSSRSLLIDSCIFSILFSRFLIIFTIIILNSFSSNFPVSSSFIWTFVFLVCYFICAVFLCIFIFF